MERLMRGKKADPVFISEFMRESIQEGFETPAQIVERAKRIVGEIDEEIKAIVSKKIKRSKLLDVISTFENTVKDKTEEAKLLPFFKLGYPLSCKFICELVKVRPLDIGEKFQLIGSGENDPHMRFSVKQLLECRVLSRSGNQIKCGDRFDEYMKFVLREV